jgi:hypothetical protein
MVARAPQATCLTGSKLVRSLITVTPGGNFVVHTLSAEDKS